MVEKFENLSGFCEIAHLITTRFGGVSKPPFDELNLALHVGDDESAVVKNRQILADRLMIRADKLIFMNQTHSDQVEVVRSQCTPNADAIVTDQKGLFLAVMTADCVPIVLYDPVRQVVAAIHAGWRGTADQIVKKTIETMQKEFGTNPADLIAGIAPSIKSCCYEVDSVVYNPMKKINLEKSMISHGNMRWRLDLQSANKTELIRCGVKNIETIGICTACDDRFFSYRRANITGRFVTVIGMR